MKKKIISLLLCAALFLSNNLSIYALNNNREEIKLQEVSKNLNSNSSKPSRAQNLDIRNPNDYELVNTGGYAGALYDSYNTIHSLYYNNINNNYYNGYMSIVTDIYCDEPYYKDKYMDFMLFSELEDGSMQYLGKVSDYFYGDTNVRYTISLPETVYQDKEYVYMVVGIYDDDSTDYSDYIYYKMKNPYYTNTEEPNEEQNDFAVISNESIDVNNSKYTGTFDIDNNKYTINKNLKQKSYKMDINIPFDTEKNKDKILNKNNIPSKNLNLSYKVGDDKSFYVYNFTDDENESINATLLYSGTKANVWVNDNQISSSGAIKLGQEFDNNLYNKVANNFGKESDVDGDGKVNILCYDIQDGFNGSGGYIAGYFYGGDLYNIQYSNKSEIFYIDTYPAMSSNNTYDVDVTQCYSTLAHEFQHMINFNQTIFLENTVSDMDVWLNEGMSMAAEQIYTQNSLTERIDYYNYAKSIKNGHSVLYWDYYGDTLSNYSLSYLFLQYFRIQVGQGDKIFSELQSLKNNNYKDIECLIQKYIDPNMTFGQFMTNFRVALLKNEATGKYGFKGETGFNKIEDCIYSGQGISMKGGGAITKAIDASTFQIPSDKDSDVTYTIITEESNVSNEKPVISGATDKTIKVGDSFDAKYGVSSTDKEDGNLTSKISISGSVNNQVAGVYALTYSVSDSDGNKTTATRKITVLNVFSNFTVNTLNQNSTIVSGKGLSGATIKVYAGSKQIGKTVTVNSKGEYKVSIPKQAGGKTVVVKMSKSGYATIEKSTVVLKVFKVFTVNSIKTTSTIVSVKGLYGASVKIFVDGKQIGKTGTVNSKGEYKISIPKQKKGKKVVVKMSKSQYVTAEKIVTVK
ncbi:immunoglobulin-like domain-containing protein [Romboutsia sp.]|uniref:immunoglobulin-like domain-containing protein n=1 Tax=Romboutsia sp. TaxID=1965302 RepID=UPI003F37E541